jgi:predicted phage-related endonuclease
MSPRKARESSAERRHFMGGSDARVIMGHDEKALIRLWQEKRGEIEPDDLSSNLVARLGLVTEDLNRQWYERNTRAISDVQEPDQATCHRCQLERGSTTLKPSCAFGTELQHHRRSRQ